MDNQELQPEVMEALSPLPDKDSQGDECAGPGGRKGSALRIIGAAALGALAYGLAVRPWHLRWGATDAEAGCELPGDDLLEHCRMETTRAITIDAPAAAIWPWLVQMGQGRGGLYSYDWLENLVGCDIHSADRIVPELQGLRVGDTFRLGPEGYPFFSVVAINPGREIVLATGPHDHAEGSRPTAQEYSPESTWAFVLRPIDADRTRLIVRFRGDWEPSAGLTLFNRVLLEPIHFVMERAMMRGIKDRAEVGHDRDAVAFESTHGTS